MDLVDKGCPPRGFLKLLGIDRQAILKHMARLSYYREIIITAKQIRILLKDKANNRSEIVVLREQLVGLFKGF